MLIVKQQADDRLYYIAFESGQQLFDWFQMLRMAQNRLVAGAAGTRHTASQSAVELAQRAAAELVLKTRKFAKRTFDA